MLREASVLLLAFAIAGSAARADDGGSPSPAPSPTPAQRPDATVDESLISPVRSYTIQGTYTGATYGPGNASGSQVIQRLAAFYVGKSLMRVTLPRLQTINGLDSGYGDLQVFYLHERGLRQNGSYAGLFAQLPTGTPAIFSTEKWLVGPALAHIFVFKPRAQLIGILLQTAFSVAGPRSVPAQSAISFLPFATLSLKNGWFFKLPESPWLFDLERGQTLIALGGGFGRAARIAATPCLLSISDEATVVHANVVNAPKNTLRLTITFLIVKR
ncbi:MAG: hypothetical protein JO322_00300 [Candidatus Eremiobacteraeota bacterium]|nr:hypothetical protein [Candidatus Eremiobacteraeota bacterium]